MVLTTSGVPTPSNPPSDPINMRRPVVVVDALRLCAAATTTLPGAAKKDVLRATEMGVARKACAVRLLPHKKSSAAIAGAMRNLLMLIVMDSIILF